MATAIIKIVLPGLTGYAAGDLRLALRLHSAAQDGAVVASNLSLTPDAVFSDTYWTTVAGFAGLCDARITEGTTVRGFGYVLMDDTTGVHVVVGSPDIAEITGVIGITAAVANKIADHVRRRTQANVEASSDGDTLNLESHYGSIQMQQESAIAGTVITVKKTDGTTTLGTKTAVLDANALPIAGVS